VNTSAGASGQRRPRPLDPLNPGPLEPFSPDPLTPGPIDPLAPLFLINLAHSLTILIPQGILISKNNHF